MTIRDLNLGSPRALMHPLERVAAGIVRQVPTTVRAARAGTRTAEGAIEGLSDSTLRWVAASSMGLAAGLKLSGKRRLAVVAGLVPALVAAASIESRRLGRPLGRPRAGAGQVELPIADV